MNALWEQRQRALILAGRGVHLARHHAAHLTLACDLDSRRQARFIEPVSWRANEVALIRSVAGRPVYETRASWRLEAREMSAQ